MKEIPFEVRNFKLDGKKIIEASAGTGKTFSIAILVVRLVIEKRCNVKSILMMTFTKSAAAEMEERIRQFIRDAYLYIQGGHINNTTLQLVINNYANTPEKKLEVKNDLKNAILELDQLSVSTIHSFCSSILNEFAFETGQLFGAEPIDDLTLLIEEYVNVFWRKNVAVLDTILLTEFIELEYNRKVIVNLILEILGGKKYLPFDVNKTYTLNSLNIASSIAIIEREFERVKELVTEMPEVDAKKALKPLIETQDYKAIAETILNAYKSNKKAKNLVPFLELIKSLQHSKLIQDINCMAICEIKEKIINHMYSKNIISFDSMIDKMEESISSPFGNKIKTALTGKYSSVFIDEFQDTDKNQYNIFKKVFIENNNETFVCLIGDPKQMIYAWRKADMATYNLAKLDMDKDANGDHILYYMEENYRSSANYIDAMNIFFKNIPTVFETFNLPKQVEYMPINFPVNDARTLGELIDSTSETQLEPISIELYQNKKDQKKRFIRDIQELLSSTSTIRIPDHKSNNHLEKVKPSDIGVLVKKNKEALLIKKLLNKYGIPAVIINDSNIFETFEAEQILYLLEAFTERTPNKIKRALLTTFIDINSTSIQLIDADVITEKFKLYNDIFEKRGVYHALKSFFTEFNIQHFLLFDYGIGGDRIYSNLIQIAESLQQTEHGRKLSPTDLKIWLRGMIAQKDNLKNTDYEQNIESDENAVKIATIHKAKGLEYNIVFAPFLDLKPFKFGFSSFRKEDTFNFVEYESLGSNEVLFLDQVEQENKRLIYVAITRAKYRCYILATNHAQSKGTISKYFNKIKDHQENEINGLIKLIPFDQDYTNSLRYPRKGFFRDSQQAQPPTPKEFLGVFPVDNWWKMSYSRLASKNHVIKDYPKPDEIADVFDKFVFEQFPKGAKAGNILHTILEKIDFTTNADSNWDNEIDSALNFYRVKGNLENLKSNIKLWLEHILNTEITMPDGVVVKLSQVEHKDRINEFEFDFNMNEFDVKSVANALPNIEVRINTELESIKGVMNGKMDLFFRYNDKYYILDWKSNFLGFTIDDYNISNIEEAMGDSNYHLQYIIYTMAARMYLSNRIPNFEYESQFGGVVYLFLRGVRKNLSTGIYTNKPTLETLDSIESLVHHEIII